MFKKLFFIAIVIAIVITVAYYKNVTVVRDKVDRALEEGELAISEIRGHKTNALRQGRSLVDEKLKSGYDLVNRPCLAEEIVPGWAIDMVHQPIEEIDKLPQNQCKTYLDGTVENIIIFDEYGHQISNGIKLGL